MMYIIFSAFLISGGLPVRWASEIRLEPCDLGMVDVLDPTGLVHLQTHPIVDLIVRQSDMIFVDRIPLLQLDLLPIRSSLRRNKFLEISDGVF